MRTLRDGFWASFLSVCIFLRVGSGLSFAHDPGLSSGQFRIQPQRLETELIFARADIESLVHLDADGDGRISPLELQAAHPALDRLAREALAICVDERSVAVTTSAFQLDETNNVHFKGTFPLRQARTLAIRSRLIDQLPRGHRQFVTVLGPTHDVLAEALLSAAQDAIRADLDPLSSSPAITLHPHTFTDFLKLGVEHILTGYDHLLFLLALLMVAPGFRQAALIITSFTVAHSITLGLATLGVVNFPSKYVEPLIAASILYVGIENVVRREGASGRWLLTFAFGLVHGFGFASVLREMGVTSGTTGIAVPLLSFNLGVEIGQVTIAAIVLPMIWRARQSALFGRYAVPICSSLVIALGAWWLLERTLQ
jgi:hydrogenase/urease accessory protein HupE